MGISAYERKNERRVPHANQTKLPVAGSKSACATLTPLGAASRGLVAGAVGTLAMDSLLFMRYRRKGGAEGFADWEFSRSVASWEDAPAPAQVGKRLLEGFLGRGLPARRARLVNNATHWATGLLASAQYGLVAGSLPNRRIRYGLPFGAGLWSVGYAVLPAAGIYRPIWRYDRRTLARDLTAHLVFGVSTAATFRLLSRPAGDV